MDYLHASDASLLKMVATADGEEIQWLVEQCRPKTFGGNKRLQTLYQKKDKTDRLLLHHACMYNTDEVATLLLVDDKTNFALSTDKYGANPAMYASRGGLAEFVKKWLDKYFNSVCNVDKEGRNMLHYCCGGGEISPDLLGAKRLPSQLDLDKVTECAKILMEKGIDVHQKDNFGITPLEYAVEHGLSKIVAWILPIPSEFNKFYQTKGHIDVLLQESPQRLVGGIIHLYVRLCFTCNHGYTNEWKVQGLKRMISDLQLNVNHVDDNKMTVLHYLCFYSYDNEPYGLREALLETLLELGANHTMKDVRGNTPLMCAMERGFVKLNDMTDPRLQNQSNIWKILSAKVTIHRSVSLSSPRMQPGTIVCPACSFKLKDATENARDSEGQTMIEDIESLGGRERNLSICEADRVNEMDTKINMELDKTMLRQMQDQIEQLMKHSAAQRTNFEKELNQTKNKFQNEFDKMKESSQHLQNSVVELQQKLSKSDEKCEELTGQVNQLTVAMGEMSKINEELVDRVEEETKLPTSIY